ncbi:hypothetical protein D3C78_1635570 [compost metagenome]
MIGRLAISSAERKLANDMPQRSPSRIGQPGALLRRLPTISITASISSLVSQEDLKAETR